MSAQTRIELVQRANDGALLRIETWMGDDTFSGAALVAEWAELGDTPFTAKRILPSELPK